MNYKTMKHVIEHVDDELTVCYGSDFLIESNTLFLYKKNDWIDIGVNMFETVSFTREEMKCIAEYILEFIKE